MVFCSIGVFSINSGKFEVDEAALFGIFGYMLMKLDLPAAPLLLGLVLGPSATKSACRLAIAASAWSGFAIMPTSMAILVTPGSSSFAVARDRL